MWNSHISWFCFVCFCFSISCINIFPLTVWTPIVCSGRDLWVVVVVVVYFSLHFNVCSSVEHSVKRSMQQKMDVYWNIQSIHDWVSFTSLDAFVHSFALTAHVFGFILPAVLFHLHTSAWNALRRCLVCQLNCRVFGCSFVHFITTLPIFPFIVD